MYPFLIQQGRGEPIGGNRDEIAPEIPRRNDQLGSFPFFLPRHTDTFRGRRDSPGTAPNLYHSLNHYRTRSGESILVKMPGAPLSRW